MEILIVSIVILIITLNIYSKFKTRKILKSEDYIINHNLLVNFFNELNHFKSDYIIHTSVVSLKDEYKEVYYYFTKSVFDKINDSRTNKFLDLYNDLDKHVNKWNKNYVKDQLLNHSDFFDNIDGKCLDIQQRKAIVVDELNNLVVAGAGSGKTLTISGKVKYLVLKKNIKPKEILLISFTRKSAEEMYKRISKKSNIDVKAKTFHKLGLDIITKKYDERPDIYEHPKSLIDQYFKKNIYKNKEMIKNLIIFFGYYIDIPKEWEEFENLDEYHDYFRTINFETLRSKSKLNEKINQGTKDLKKEKRTLQGEIVKSLEEVIIANFLFLNGIAYHYEKLYPHKSDDNYKKKYRPDFYLSDYDIYLEHFGINKNNKTPWLPPIEEEKYLEGMKWKRNFHKKHNTILIETYSYYNKDGVLLEKLRNKLKKHGVKFNEIDYERLFKNIFDQKNDKYFEEFKKLIVTFIGLFKSNDYDIEKFALLKKEANNISNSFMRERTRLFLDIVKPIYIFYEKFLKNNNLIDFNDMINNATNIIKSEPLNLEYKYIIIDEYQDISYSRFNLIRAIRDKTKAKIMCVGDDWQSIFRFAGSDIELFTSFEKYFGYSELLKIERTYRNSQQLIDIAGDFIVKNKSQIKKDLISSRKQNNPIRIFGFKKDIITAIKKAIDEIVDLFGEETEIMFLGRNNFDTDFIETSYEFHLKYNRDKKIEIKYNKFPKLKLNFLTVHKSKGIEAENVIIINAYNKTVGFPNKISDDPLLSLVLKNASNYPYAEERRLFYVALTRTKNRSYIIAPDTNMSVFVKELIEDYTIEFNLVTNEKSVLGNPNCPKCQKGYLVLRKNETTGNKFLGCTNYPSCDFSNKNIEILNNHIKCVSCDSYMVKRKGRYGEFYGCINYPFCEQTIRIENLK